MISRRNVLMAFGAAATLSRVATAADVPVAGTWTGVLEAGSQRLRLKFEIGADGTVVLYSLDQGGTPIPGKATSLTAERVEIEIGAVRGSFRGKLVAADRIEGTWRQGGEMPLVLLRGEGGLTAPAKALAPLTQEALEALRRGANVPALGAAAAVKGRPATKWFSGERASGSGVAVTGSDQWHLGSITKSFTATLCARLVESGVIRWDDTVGDLLKGVVPQMQAAYKPVTFRHLLCHRSGLPGNIPIEQLMKFPRESTDIREDRRSYARIALQMQPVGPMGATFGYANNGFVVVGAMLEAKLDKTWEELLRTHVLTPLKLTSAGFGAPGKKGELTQPVGHAFDGKAHMAMRVGEGVSDNPAVIGPAGRLHMSFDDVLAYLAVHADGRAFLKPESLRTLHTPPFGGEYAMGWIVRPGGELWHNGSNTLWYAEVLVSPTSGIAAVAAANEAQQTTPAAVGQALMRAAQTMR